MLTSETMSAPSNSPSICDCYGDIILDWLLVISQLIPDVGLHTELTTMVMSLMGSSPDQLQMFMAHSVHTPAHRAYNPWPSFQYWASHDILM